MKLAPEAPGCGALAVVAEIFPEFGPRLEQATADENVRMVLGFFIFHAETIPGVTSKLAGREILLEKMAREPDDDERLRRRIAVAAGPERIDAADGAGQPVTFAVEIDGAGFAVVSCEDAEMRAVIDRKRIADLGSSLRELLPAELLAQITVDGVRAFLSLIEDDDAGLFVATGGFTSEAHALTRTSRRKIRLIDLEGLFDLWVEFYHKLDDRTQERLPISPIYFITPRG